ncbi:hypothetical protein [Aeromicrobium sp. UC242_57]
MSSIVSKLAYDCAYFEVYFAPGSYHHLQTSNSGKFSMTLKPGTYKLADG